VGEVLDHFGWVPASFIVSLTLLQELIGSTVFVMLFDKPSCKLLSLFWWHRWIVWGNQYLHQSLTYYDDCVHYTSSFRSILYVS
jgi:hypothetical protein